MKVVPNFEVLIPKFCRACKANSFAPGCYIPPAFDSGMISKSMMLQYFEPMQIKKAIKQTKVKHRKVV